MRYTATKVAKIPFTRQFEVEDAAEGFLRAEEDWHTTGGQGWAMGEVTFNPTTLEGASETVSVSRKPVRERLLAR